jgi:hypothetical protein
MEPWSKLHDKEGLGRRYEPTEINHRKNFHDKSMSYIGVARPKKIGRKVAKNPTKTHKTP